MTNDPLYELISSLSISEKRHFILYASRYEKRSKQYLKLYYRIEKSDGLNLGEIKKEFLRETSESGYYVLRNYLTNLVLSSLRELDAGSSPEQELRECLQEIAILYRKGLAVLYSRKIKLARKFCEDYQMSTYLPLVIEWERRVALDKKNFVAADLLYDKKKLVYSNLTEIDQITRLYYQIFEFHNVHFKPRDSDQEAYLKALLMEVDRVAGKSNIPDEVVNRRDTIYALYYVMNNEFLKAYQLFDKIAKHMEANPALIKKSPISYLRGALLNRTIQAYDSGDFQLHEQSSKELVHNMDKFRKQINETTYASIINVIHNNRLRMYLDTAQYQKAYLELNQINSEQGEGTIETHYSSLISLEMNMAFSSFAVEDYSQALQYLNKVIDNPLSQTTRIDTYINARLLSLITHYELGNFDVIPSYIKSTYRFFRKKDTLFEFEEEVLKFLQNSEKFDTREKLISGLTSLRKQLSQIDKSPYNVAALKSFQIMSWLDSKINRTSFIDAAKKNLKHGN